MRPNPSFDIKRYVAAVVLLLLTTGSAFAQPALEAKHTATIEAFAECFGMPGFSKEEGQAWVGRLASTFAARFQGEGWGTKRASNSRPLSNESIARPAGGRLWSYDLIIGAGAPGQRLEPRAHPEDITDQVFVQVQAFDHLAGCGGPSQPPPDTGGAPNQPPPAPTPIDLGPIIAKMNEAIAAQRDTHAAIVELNATLSRLHASLEEMRAHDLVSANEQRITRDQVLAALRGTLRVRIAF
jgi:hypothetical protein